MDGQISSYAGYDDWYSSECAYNGYVYSPSFLYEVDFYSCVGGYEFLMENYQTGDRIFIFGFSRGAYTARALAGM